MRVCFAAGANRRRQSAALARLWRILKIEHRADRRKSTRRSNAKVEQTTMPLNHDSSSAQPARKPALSDEEKRARKAEYQRKYHEAHAEQLREKARAYYEGRCARGTKPNPELLKEYARTYRKAHPEREVERLRKYREAHAEQIAERMREWSEANAERLRKYREAHAEQKAEYTRKWYEAHAEQVAGTGRAYREAHAEEYARYRREWSKAHPDSRRAAAAQRRAHKAGSKGKVTAKDRERLYVLQGGKCAACGKKMSRKTKAPYQKKATHDHVIPLNDEGPHTPENAQILCGKCNSEKGAMDPYKFAARKGKLFT